MSLENLREKNIQMVVEKALLCFEEQGIENTKVRDIAKAAGLTERSVFRYFATKTDIIQAAAYLMWCRTLENVAAEFWSAQPENLTGIEQIEILLNLYSRLFLKYPKKTRFSLDAETALFSANRSEAARRRPPEPYEGSKSPMVMAIRKGLEDGTVNPRYDPKELYYNTYDSVLGVMQRMVVDTTSATDLDNELRMKHLCEIFIREFRGE